MSDERSEALKLRNQLSFFCAGKSATIVASALADLLVTIYTECHPSPSLDDYLAQMRMSYEHYMARAH